MQIPQGLLPLTIFGLATLVRSVPILSRDLQQGTCTVIAIAVSLSTTQYNGYQVNARLLKASAGIATLTAILDTIATWMDSGSMEYEAAQLKAASTTVTTLSVVLAAGSAVAPNTVLLDTARNVDPGQSIQ